MKIEPAGDGWQISFADQQEAERWHIEEASMRQMIPNLMSLWEVEPRFAGTVDDCWEIMKEGVKLTDFHVADLGWLTGSMGLLARRVEAERKAGRPLSDRTIVAAMRLPLFSPYEEVLRQEKERRLREEEVAVRDKNVAAALARVHKKAVMEADNCVRRAWEMVKKARADYVKGHPDHLAYFLVAEKVVSDLPAKPVEGQTLRAKAGRPLVPTINNRRYIVYSCHGKSGNSDRTD